jgi:two-component system response regulator YesN
MFFTVSIGAVMYVVALRVVEKDATESNVSMLRQSSEVIDARLKEVENIVTQVSFHPKISSLLNITSLTGDTDSYKAIDTWKYIQNYKFTSDFIGNFYVHFNHTDVIMSPKDMSLRMQMYYQESLKFKGLTYDEWNAELLQKYHKGEYLPAREIVVNGKQNVYVTYIQSIPLGFNQPKGTILVLIPETEIHRMLNRLNLQNGAWSYISDSNGRVITSIGGQKEPLHVENLALKGKEGFIQHRLEGEDMLVSYYQSPESKWTYVSAIPTRLVMKKVDDLKQVNMFIIIIGLLVGLIIAIFFANQNSKPIRALIKRFGEKLTGTSDSNSNEYSFLEGSISRLIVNNEALHLEIQQQTPLLRAALLDRLLRGEFNDADEIEVSFDDWGLPVQGNYYIVAVLRLKWLEEGTTSVAHDSLTIKRIIMKEILSNELGHTGFIHDLRQERIAILLNFAMESREHCESLAIDTIRRLSEMVNEFSDIQVAFGVGSIYGNLLDVYRSFNEANKALDMLTNRNESYVLRYDEIPKDDDGYYYPIEIEQRMINLVKSGNEKEVRKLFEDIYKENTWERHMSSNTMKLLIFDISATGYKLIHDVFQLNGKEEDLAYRDFIERVSSFQAFQEAFVYITDTLANLCRYVNTQKKSRNVDLKDRIISYLHMNYSDGNLCLANVAEHFSISEVYLSQFFKEQVGENFSSYMERIRMNHACKLLLKENLTVDDIAKQVGYHNTNTFYKAFKRMEGISPGTFRKNTGQLRSI